MPETNMNGDDIWPVKGPALSGWNPSAPLNAFQAFAVSIHEKAKELLVRDGRHSEMLFFVPLSGRCHIVQWQGTDRDVQAAWMQKLIAKHYIYGVIHVCECWMRVANGPDDPMTKRVVSGEMRVSQLPPEDRIEALSVTAQTRDGYSHNWIDEMLRDKEKKILSLGKCVECDSMGGRFGELFK